MYVYILLGLVYIFNRVKFDLCREKTYHSKKGKKKIITDHYKSLKLIIKIKNYHTIYKTCKLYTNNMNYEMHIIINQKKYQLSLKVLKIR